MTSEFEGLSRVYWGLSWSTLRREWSVDRRAIQITFRGAQHNGGLSWCHVGDCPGYTRGTMREPEYIALNDVLYWISPRPPQTIMIDSKCTESPPPPNAPHTLYWVTFSTIGSWPNVNFRLKIALSRIAWIWHKTYWKNLGLISIRELFP